MSETTIVEAPKEDRKSVIAAALAVADKADVKTNEETQDVKTDKVDEKKTTEVSEKKTEAQPTEDQLLAEQGKQLLLALRNPEQAPVVIKFLAEQAGYSKLPTTKVEEKELVDDILKDLKDSMGDEFSIIAERLAPAVKKIVTREVEKSQVDIREELQNQETAKLKDQAATVLTNLGNDFFGDGEEFPPEVTKAMSAFMDNHQPSSTSSIKEYTEDAFHFAIGKLGIQKSDKVKSAKTERNRTDASSRLASARAPQEDNIRRDDSKPITRQEAIRLAIEKANKE